MKPLLVVLLLLWGLGMVYGVSLRLPPGLDRAGVWRPAQVEFLYDLTFRQGDQERREQAILAAMRAEIERAQNFIICDIFLLNRLGGEQVLRGEMASPVQALTEALLAARRARPELPILVISDELNTGYGSYPEPHLETLAAHGITVVLVDLTRLPDSNPLYSGLWRPLLQWFKPDGRGTLANPFAAGAPAMNLASFLRLLNFKANHRKLLITEQAALVSSGNIHDASARHSNIAFRVRGPIIAELAAAELAVARFSGSDFTLPAEVATAWARQTLEHGREETGARVRLITESAIREALLAGVAAAGAGDRIWLAHFYLAERRVLAALVAAARRGAQVRLILDPNRRAFGRNKYGIPNLSSAAWLERRGGENLEIRWYETGGEQFHAKLTMIAYGDGGDGRDGRDGADGGDRHSGDGYPAAAPPSAGPGDSGGEVLLIGGSANLTRRNLAGYNLESNLEIRVAAADPLALAVQAYFQRLWSNQDGRFTVPYQKFAENRPGKAAWAAWQEFSGMGTF